MTTEDRNARAKTATGRENVENILPLLPLQKALLLHRDTFADREDPGFLQVRCRLTGALRPETFREAWNRVVSWHPGLRMSVHERRQKDPVAVVWRDVDLPWTYTDMRNTDDSELEHLIASDRDETLDLAKPPVMRLHLIRTDEDLHELVWTCHHLFLDGWSAAIVLEDVMHAYRELTHDREPRQRVPDAALSRYIKWRLNREDTGAEAYWRKRLAGFEGVPPLRLGLPDGTESGELRIELEPAVAESVRQAAANSSLTANALIQGAWALTLRQLFGSDDVVFGTTVAGRSADIEAIEKTVGYFANVVPVRVVIEPDQPIVEWLRHLRDDQFEMQPHEHSTLADIQGWSDLPGHRPLFDTFLVVENFPSQPGSSDPSDVTLSEFSSGLTTAYPLTVAVALGDTWAIECRYDTQRCDREAVESLLDAFERSLGQMAEDPESPVGHLETGGGLHNLLTTGQEPAVKGDRNSDPPRTETEKHLAAIWQDVLGIEQIGVHDDYFALGGTSITAVGLFSRIEAEMDASLPLSALLQQPTIAGLAGLISGPESANETWESLVPLRTEGSQPPIVCVHAGGAHVMFYRDLAEHLGDDQPVYGLEPIGLDGAVKPLESIPEMASRYIDELRTVQPEGPYRFLGYCVGGALSLEMAHQLESAGQTVELVTVVDSGLPIDPALSNAPTSRIRTELDQGGIRHLSGFLLRRARGRAARLREKVFGGAGGRRKVNHELVERACRRAFRTYRPNSIQAPILLIRSTDYAQRETKDRHMQWAEVTPELHVEIVDARHVEIMEDPAVKEVAASVLSHLTPR